MLFRSRRRPAAGDLAGREIAEGRRLDELPFVALVPWTANVRSESSPARRPCPGSTAVTTTSSVARAFLYFSHERPRLPGRYGVAIARRGWIEKRDVLNALGAEEFAAAVKPRAARR